jgi:tetratricopeptide (TPR) repeat protein
MKTKGLFLAFTLAAISASPPNAATDPLRIGLQLLESGDNERALASLETASQQTDDPGLVAYNRGIALARLGRLREAELQFIRCLDDDAIPTERRAKALYNRGVCLLSRDDLPAIRTAIDCFSLCRDEAADAVLVADAKHNLEVAKARWQRARLKETQPPSPSEGGYEPPSPPRTHDSTAEDASANSGANGSAAAKAQPTLQKVDSPAKSTNQMAPGAGTLPVLKDDAVLTPLSPDDTQAYLDQTAKRLARQRLNVERLRGGPDRPGVRDW